MKHIDLFSGIGGFALAIERVWPNTEHIFCDNNPFCQEVIKKHWPKAPIVSDIRQFTTDTRDNKHNPIKKKVYAKKKIKTISGEALDTGKFNRADILTGGFPCQPFSQAGQRKGTADDRYLWPEMLRVIREFYPEWVVAENVSGLLTWSDGMVFRQVCSDLEDEGYEVQPFVIPAVAVNAPHRRDRVWIVANRTSGRERSGKRKGNSTGKSKAETGSGNRDVTDTRCFGQKKQQKQTARNEQCSWLENWLEVATRLCGVDDGLPAKLDEFELSKSRHRIERLKALGNAIVPQVAEEIFRAIKLCNQSPRQN